MTKPRWLMPPSTLSKSAAEYWTFYASGLQRTGHLGAENAEHFRQLCELLALAGAASAEIERSGVLIETQTGAKKSNPAIATLLAAQRAADPLLAKFGLA